MRRSVLPSVMVLSLAGMVLSLGGCGWASRHDETSKPDGFLLHGYVSVSGAATGVAGTACLAPAGVTDIVEGGPVRVGDADGHVLAATTLDSGVLAQADGGYTCNFAFELRNLSSSRATYTIMVGDRPATRFQTKELREGRPAVIPVAATGSSSPS